MANIVAVESLSVISYQNKPVVTTELLAQLYGTEVSNIHDNYRKNVERFAEGKHFIKLEGEPLREFKKSLTGNNPGSEIPRQTRNLILWTERGAARHAKMLDTDQAWEVFEKLEDSYFTVNKSLAAPMPYAVNPGDLLTKEEADMLRNMNTAAAERLPKEKRGAFLMAGWSKLKAHFKCEYRRIPRAEFTEALNIMARHVSEIQLLPTPTALHEEARKRALFAALEIERQLIEQFVTAGEDVKHKRWCVYWDFDGKRCHAREFLPDETIFSFKELDAAMRPIVDIYRRREIAVYAK